MEATENKLSSGERVKIFIKTKFFLFLLMFIIIALLHLLYKMTSDDILYYEAFSSGGYAEYIISRWENWSGRVLIDSVLYFLMQSLFVFALIDSLFLVLIIYAFSEFLGLHAPKKILYIVALLMLLPVYLSQLAGWYSTSVNYFWPIACVLVAACKVKKHIITGLFAWYDYVILILSCLFAAGSEFGAVILVFTAIVTSVYLARRKQVSVISAIVFIFGLAGIIICFICPGNAARGEYEATQYFPEYASYNIVQKFTLGLACVTTSFGLMPNPALYIFYIALIIIAFKRNRRVVVKFLSVIPLAVVAIYYISLSVAYLAGGDVSSWLNAVIYSDGLVFDDAKIYVFAVMAILISIPPLFVIIDLSKRGTKLAVGVSYLFAVCLAGIIGFTSAVQYYSCFRPTFFSALIVLFLFDFLMIQYNNENRDILRIKKLIPVSAAMLIAHIAVNVVVAFI